MDYRTINSFERYNRNAKDYVGNKVTCNLLVLIKYIAEELNKIESELIKNSNINALFNAKKTKFGVEKYINKLSKKTRNNCR